MNVIYIFRLKKVEAEFDINNMTHDVQIIVPGERHICVFYEVMSQQHIQADILQMSGFNLKITPLSR